MPSHRRWTWLRCFVGRAADTADEPSDGAPPATGHRSPAAPAQHERCSSPPLPVKSSPDSVARKELADNEAIVKAAHAAALDVVSRFARAELLPQGLHPRDVLPQPCGRRSDQGAPTAVVFPSDLDPFADDASPRRPRLCTLGSFEPGTHEQCLAVPPLRTATAGTLHADDIMLQQPGAPRWRPSGQCAFDVGLISDPTVSVMAQPTSTSCCTDGRSTRMYEGSDISSMNSLAPSAAPARLPRVAASPGVLSAPTPGRGSARLRHPGYQGDVLSSFLSVLPPVHAPNPQRFKRTVTEPPLRLDSPPSSGVPTNPFFGPGAAGGRDNNAHITTAGGLLHNSAPVSLCRQTSAGSRLQGMHGSSSLIASPVLPGPAPLAGGWLMPGAPPPAPRRIPTPPIPVPPARPAVRTSLPMCVPMVQAGTPAMHVPPVMPLPHILGLAPVAAPPAPLGMTTPFTTHATIPVDENSSPCGLRVRPGQLQPAGSLQGVSCTARSSMSLANWVGVTSVRVGAGANEGLGTPRSPAPEPVPEIGGEEVDAAQEPEDLINLFNSWGSAEWADETPAARMPMQVA